MGVGRYRSEHCKGILASNTTTHILEKSTRKKQKLMGETVSTVAAKQGEIESQTGIYLYYSDYVVLYIVL